VAERLDAFLAHRGHGSRSEVKARIRRGEVRIDGQVCRDPGTHVDPGADIRVGDETVADGIHEATLLLHKPVGYSCSHDQRESPTVDALIPETHRHLPSERAGRLDRMTSGLLVLTTEGDLIHRLTNPRRKLAKRYRIAYSGRLSSHAVERCAKGITLDGDPRPTLPAKLRRSLAAGGLITRGQERCLYVFSAAEFERVHDRMRQAPMGDKRARDFLRMFLAAASDEKPDSQNRVTIPPALRAYAGLERDLVVAGIGDHAEIWQADRWAEYTAANEDAFAELEEEVYPGLF